MGSVMMQSTILLDQDDASSNLNPNAAPFVPTSHLTTPSSPSNASPPLPAMAAPYPPSPSNGGWLASGWLEYSSPDMVDSLTGYYCDREDFLRAQLYQPPQQPKGDTRGRARPRRQ